MVNTTWITLEFNKLQIKAETDKATLIQLPSNSNYKGWGFFHPSKLIKTVGGKGYFKSFTFSDNWEFRLVRVGKKSDATLTLTADEMMRVFEPLQAFRGDSYYKEIEPVKINKEVKVDDTLWR